MTQPPDELAPRRKRGSRKGPHVISGAKHIEVNKRHADALALRQAGASLAQIADQLGYASATGAHQAIMAALKTVLPDETRAEHRRLELTRLDRLILAHWQAALEAGPDFDRHARVVMQAIGMRCKLLGLEAPTQVDVRVREGDMVHVEILDLLSKETLRMLRPFQDDMVRLSELRAGAIDVTPDDDA